MKTRLEAVASRPLSLSLASSPPPPPAEGVTAAAVDSSGRGEYIRALSFGINASRLTRSGRRSGRILGLGLEWVVLGGHLGA